MRLIDKDKFTAIVHHARRTNPFYAEWIPSEGVVPILTRQVLQENNDRILNGNPVTGKTSGSTGMPVRISSGPMRRRLEADDNRRISEWLGGQLPRIDIIHRRPGASQHVIPIDTPVGGQILALSQRAARHDAVALMTYPTNAILLAQAILEQRLTFPSIRRILLMSEPVDADQRAFVQRAFPGAHVWSSYSSIEFGTIAGQCPFHSEYYHILSYKLGVEILDEKQEAVPFGQVGQVVITDYFNRRMPLIRYALGDLAAFGKCPCGKIPLPAFSKVLGKVRGALVYPNGRRIPFVEFAIVLRDLPGIKQFQVIQEELRRFTVKVAASQNIDAEIKAAFLKEFGYAPKLDIQYLDTIPRDPGGKFFISICKV